MAVRFDANTGEYIERTTSLLNYNSTYTIMGWFRIVNDENDYGTLFYLGASSSVYEEAALDSNGTRLAIFEGASSGTGSNLSVGTWYHIALVRTSPTSLVLWLDGNIHINYTNNVGTSRTAPDSLSIGNSVDFTTDNFDGRVAAVKAWDTNLTQAEIIAESEQFLPIKRQSLHMFTPLQIHTDLTDYSGNGRDWTGNGTLTTEDDPPIPWRKEKPVYIDATSIL